MLDEFVKSRQRGRHSKKLQMQGAQILRNEAYIEVRRSDEGCLPASGGKRNAADGLFTKPSCLFHRLSATPAAPVLLKKTGIAS
jgi:hypothetical protein